jgi:REP element-mobilizing transposase RayT
MNDLFDNKYRLHSTRFSLWDYGSNGKYFVTICTDRKVPYFGHLEHSVVLSTEIGDYAKICWQSIPEHYPFVELDSFILMPDHLHGILCFGKKERTDWNPN